MEEKIANPKIDHKNYRRNENGWIFVHVEGAPLVRGFEYGSLMANEIVQAVNDAKSLVEVQTGVSWEFFLHDEMSILHNWKESFKIKEYQEFYDELVGIANGVTYKTASGRKTGKNTAAYGGV